MNDLERMLHELEIVSEQTEIYAYLIEEKIPPHLANIWSRLYTLDECKKLVAWYYAQEVLEQIEAQQAEEAFWNELKKKRVLEVERYQALLKELLEHHTKLMSITIDKYNNVNSTDTDFKL